MNSKILSIFVLISILIGIGSAQPQDVQDAYKATEKYDKSYDFSVKEKDKIDVIIGFNSEIETGTINKIEKEKKGKIKRIFKPIKAMSARLTKKDIDDLIKDPSIRYIEDDAIAYITSQSTPWGINRVNATLVHPIYKGNGTKVAVIDTGIDMTHPDLDNNYLGGYDYVHNDYVPADDHGHGTHVSGIVAAEDNGEGVIGVAPEAKLFAVKAFNYQGIGMISDLIPAIYDSANNGAQIISMSWQVGGDYQALHDAIIYAYNKGTVLVAASGNDNGGYVRYPAAYSEVIAISATNESDKIAYFSNIGEKIELSAPGTNINSTMPGGGYGYKSGTSMAVPHVSGVAALILASEPNLTNTEVRKVMQRMAVDLGSPGRDIYYGYGLIDANASIHHPDIFPPKSITNPTVIENGTNFINWTWNDPNDPDFSKVMVYINGIFQNNIPKGIQYFNATDLNSGVYTISTKTVDNVGNVNDTWINNTAMTLGADIIPPITIINRIGDHKTGDWFASFVDINFTATDDISGVNRTEYRLYIYGDWTRYIGTFPILSEGNTTVQYRSIDNAGNIEPMNWSLVRIDTIYPTISVSVTDGAVYNTDITPVITVSDSNLVYQSTTLNEAPFLGGPITQNGSYWLNTTAIDIVDHISNNNVSFIINKSEIIVPPVECKGSCFRINYNVTR